MTDIREIATGLQFPEGPVAMSDGSILFVEVRRGTLSRATGGGAVEVVAELGGGPNGAAIGPDGAAYVCNNGGFLWAEIQGRWVPMDLTTGSSQPPDFRGGWIERVDLDSGKAERLYEGCDGHRFCGPNDIVFDGAGGFWFTDFGKQRARETDRGGLYHARADGSSVTEVAYGLWGPNGVGLSPAGDRVYVAESYTGRLLAWDLEAPGQARSRRPTIVAATKGHFDSLAVEASGAVVVAAIGDGLCVIEPDGSYDYVALPDSMTTNVCFGGAERRTAYATLSGSGRLVALDWRGPGLELAHTA
jgi:gluconolactonase